MKLETAKKKYKGQWFMFDFENGSNSSGRVIAHDKNHHKMMELFQMKARYDRVYLMCGGPAITRPGFTIL